jgi:hypothetical protein
MATLRQYLAATPRRMLLAIAQARGVRIPWEAPKTALVTVLADKLLDSAQLGQVLESFSEAEHRVLNDLVAVGGRIPRRYLAYRYGDVRPYRPWQPDAPCRPWENPVSPVERLWFLGLIFLELSTDDLVVPDDLLPHLPSPEQRPPEPVPDQGGLEPALLAAHDLACLLGLLQRDDVRPLYGRWLPPRLLAAWGEMCAWPPASPNARGELQTGRPRFLHYLAEAAGLVGLAPHLPLSRQVESAGLAGPYLTQRALCKPTPAAWLWLNAPPAERPDRLWQILVTCDDDLWRAYRLSGHDPLPHPGRLLAAVAQALAELDPAHPAAFAEALLARQPNLRDLLPANLLEPETALATTIVELLAGPFVWLGALSERRGRGAPLLELTAWGAAWLGLAPTPEVPPPPRFGVTSEAASDPAAGEPGALIFTLRQGLPDPADLMLMMEAGSRE